MCTPLKDHHILSYRSIVSLVCTPLRDHHILSYRSIPYLVCAPLRDHHDAAYLLDLWVIWRTYAIEIARYLLNKYSQVSIRIALLDLQKGKGWRMW